jgi:hypothetical protein
MSWTAGRTTVRLSASVRLTSTARTTLRLAMLRDSEHGHREQHYRKPKIFFHCSLQENLVFRSTCLWSMNPE